jgi:hypothetical protein
MSKSKLKKSLEAMTKDEIMQFVLDLYERSSSVKGLIDTSFKPDAGKDLVKKYRKSDERKT